MGTRGTARVLIRPLELCYERSLARGGLRPHRRELILQLALAFFVAVSLQLCCMANVVDGQVDGLLDIGVPQTALPRAACGTCAPT